MLGEYTLQFLYMQVQKLIKVGPGPSGPKNRAIYLKIRWLISLFRWAVSHV